MTTAGFLVRVGLLAGLALLASPALGHAQLTLATAAAPRYSGGTVKCSAVDVGSDTLDVVVALYNVDTGAVEVTTTCAGDGTADGEDAPAVAANERCTAESDSTSNAVVFCKITVNLEGGTGTPPNPALAALRQEVRGNITSLAADNSSFVVQAAE